MIFQHFLAVYSTFVSKIVFHQSYSLSAGRAGVRSLEPGSEAVHVEVMSALKFVPFLLDLLLLADRALFHSVYLLKSRNVLNWGWDKAGFSQKGVKQLTHSRSLDNGLNCLHHISYIERHLHGLRLIRVVHYSCAESELERVHIQERKW